VHTARVELTRLVHNDFHEQHEIFAIFDGLAVPDIDKPLHETAHLNGELSNGTSVSIVVNGHEKK
jgi:methylenetetrahydrofolate reductase (NADPH)